MAGHSYEHENSRKTNDNQPISAFHVSDKIHVVEIFTFKTIVDTMCAFVMQVEKENCGILYGCINPGILPG